MKTSVLFPVCIILVVSTTLDSSNAKKTNYWPILNHKTRLCNFLPKTVYCPQHKEGLRWFYNPDQKTCVEYSGCPPKPDSYIIDNNFPSKEECLEFCNGVERKISPRSQRDALDLCTIPLEPGPCRGYFPMWYYDSETKQCKEFIYGGCGGNKNQFESEKACLGVCRN